ncbi:MAG: hypothetical protein QMC67_10210 [Candidatus Wallbacteria bacterium]
MYIFKFFHALAIIALIFLFSSHSFDFFYSEAYAQKNDNTVQAASGAAGKTIPAAGDSTSENTLDSSSVSLADSTINEYIKYVLAGDIKKAASLCQNNGESFMTDDFINDFKLFKDFKYAISSHSGSLTETVNAIVSYSNSDNDIINQEFILEFSEKEKKFSIINVFDRQYEKMSEKRHNCYIIEEFLNSVWQIYPAIQKDYSVKASPELDNLIAAGLLKGMPKCPDGGNYSCVNFYDNDNFSYEVRIRCDKHGNSWELFKVNGNFESSEKIMAAIDQGKKKQSDDYSTELLKNLFVSRDKSDEIIKLIQNDNLNDAIAKFRELQKSEKRLGKIYITLAQTLFDSDHETEAVEILKECEEIYPQWPATKDKAEYFKQNKKQKHEN